MLRFRWRWFVLKRELRHQFVCMWGKGHDFEVRDTTSPDCGGREYSLRCKRCHRIFPRVFMVSSNQLARRRNNQRQAVLASGFLRVLELHRHAKDTPRSIAARMFDE